jgi:DNA-binding IclR family transcriptional regulator
VALVLEAFEYFAHRKSPATVGEICADLRYPQSSTSVLLKTLQAMGYLHYELRSRRYAPAEKVRRLSRWVPARPVPYRSEHAALDASAAPFSQTAAG